MGDRLATIDIGRKLGAVPLWEEMGPYLTPSFVPSDILIHPAATTDMGRKLGCVLLLGRVSGIPI